jgi:hypothetical protein
MEDILRLERDRGEHWFDVVSFHPYTWDKELGFPADSIKRTHEFVDVAQRYGDGRPLWVSEISGPEGRILEFVVQVMQEPIDTVLFHSVPFAADDGTPGKLYSRMRQIISGTAHGRPHIVRVD